MQAPTYPAEHKALESHGLKSTSAVKSPALENGPNGTALNYKAPDLSSTSSMDDCAKAPGESICVHQLGPPLTYPTQWVHKELCLEGETLGNSVQRANEIASSSY